MFVMHVYNVYMLVATNVPWIIISNVWQLDVIIVFSVKRQMLINIHI